MYARSKVAQRIVLAESPPSPAPPLIYHSVAEVDAFESHLRASGMYVYDDVGQPIATQNLTKQESDWIFNEQNLVQCDAEYFLSRYCYLRNEEGVVERFQFRVPQRIYFDIIADLEERDTAIEIMALKARQLGVSIFTELLIAHRSIFSYGVSSIIGSADQTKTSDMSLMLLLCYDMLPVWLRPQHTARVQSDRGKLLFGHMASGISFQHGSQKFGIGTGSTPTIYHLSEVALYGEASVMLIDEGLWKAVHASTNVFGVLESTGRGNKGWWAKTWYHSKSKWPQSRMYPMFLPWYCGTDMYPKPAWLRKSPLPENWRPNSDTRMHVAKSELFVASTPLLKKHLLVDQDRRGIQHNGQWRMPREQQWFWEVTHEQAKYSGTESSFLQEMAGDDEEALQRSVDSVFGHDTIQMISTSRKRNYTCYGISGQSIEDRHEPPPEDIDYSAERIVVRHQQPNKPDVYRWELLPLRADIPMDEENREDAAGKLIVWHHPRPGVNYSIGVDTSKGVGEDSTVISVWSIGNRDQPDIQCAEFASSYVNHVEAYAFVMPIAAYYGQYMRVGETRWPWPYLTVEQLEAVGDTVQLQCMKMGYPVICVHKFTRLDSAPSRIHKQKKTPTKLGWYTSGWSRPLLTGNFVHFAKSGWSEINSPWLIEEMKEFEVHLTSTGKEKMEHSEDTWDDRIFAAAMATFAPADTALLAARSHKRSVESDGALPPIDLGEYRPNVFSAGQLREKTVASIEDLVYSDTRLERFG